MASKRAAARTGSQAPGPSVYTLLMGVKLIVSMVLVLAQLDTETKRNLVLVDMHVASRCGSIATFLGSVPGFRWQSGCCEADRGCSVSFDEVLVDFTTP